MQYWKFCLALILLIHGTNAFSQTVIWSDTFEDTGAPSSGTRSPSVENHYPSSPPYTRYFGRFTPSSLSLQNGTYTNVQGAKIWAAEDIDAAFNGSNFGQSAAQTITWSGINITGKTALSFRGLFGCNDEGDVWEPGPAGASPVDYMVVSYRIDGGPWKDAVRLMGSANWKMALETTGDSTGDGTPLTSYVMTEFAKGIAGTGNTLDLQFKGFSNGATTEEFAIDNFRILEGDISLPATFGTTRVTTTADQLIINWSTVSEVNNDHFEIQVSTDAKDFVTAATVQSEAINGNSSATLDYHVSLGIDDATALLGLGCCSLLFFSLSFRKKRIIFMIAAGVLGLVMYGCVKKQADALIPPGEKLYIRIVQVNKDGTRSYDKIIAVDRNN